MDYYFKVHCVTKLVLKKTTSLLKLFTFLF